MTANIHADFSRPIQNPRSSTLMMTDYFFLLALGLAIFVAVDPLEMDLERRILTKHLPMLVAVSSMALVLVGERIFRSQEKRLSSMSALTPLLWLAGFIIIGGLCARILLGVQNSFLVFGLYMLAAPIAATILLRSEPPARLRILHVYFVMLIVAGGVVFVGLAANYGVRQVYHELEYLFPPLAVLFAFLVKRTWIRWAGVIFFLLCAVLFKKNTGYLIGLLVMSYLAVFYLWPQWKRHDVLRRVMKAHWLLLGAMALAVLAAYLIANRNRYLPTGNPEFRVFTYAKAWQKFLDSPIFGTLFSGAAAEKFTAFDTGVSNNILPTHSDVLDILAHGGLLGIALWLWAVLRVARLAFSHALHSSWRSHPLTPYAHALACISLAAVLTYAFNPILLQPAKSLLVWASVGFLVAIALAIREDESQKSKKNK